MPRGTSGEGSAGIEAMIPYWLPPIADWRARIAELDRQEPGDAAWRLLADCASHRLDLTQTERLDRSLRRLFGEQPPPGLETKPVRLALLGSSTVSHLLPAIRVAALRRGLWVTTYTSEYGQYRQDLSNPASPLVAFGPTACVLALDAQHLLPQLDPTTIGPAADDALSAVVEDLRLLWRQARNLCPGQLIQQTVLPSAVDLLGQNEHRLSGAPAALLSRLNARLRSVADGEGVDLLAVDSRAALDGLAAWHDPLLWHRAKQEISMAAAPMYGELLARLLMAAQGRSAKCLVLDLDNTLWGGVIGDDGLEGIVIGQGSAAGEAFTSFQHYARALGRRGVILAVCSKNDEANALEAFERHPDMVLRRGDIAAFRADWTDKATNLRAIAGELNIGLDAMVFADDNPFERALIRAELPQVSVPELPEDPALFARCISDAGYFESLRLTADDATRTRQYDDNRKRSELLSQATDLDSYLRGLDMQLRWKRVDRVGLDRVVQLINKTNQFNLTTRRYSMEEAAAMAGDPRWLVLQLRLGDRLGDNGIVAVVIGRLNDRGQLEIDSWLMSCRVLGRRVEEATIGIVVEQAQQIGATEILGCYRPSGRNAMVADLFPRLGFLAMHNGEMEDGQRWYHLPALGTPPVDLPFAISEE